MACHIAICSPGRGIVRAMFAPRERVDKVGGFSTRVWHRVNGRAYVPPAMLASRAAVVVVFTLWVGSFASSNRSAQ